MGRACTRNDRIHFEFLILEGAHAGLSWSTILKKRDGYRKAFADFDPAKVARFKESQIEKILQNPGIVRNKLKVHAAVNNAKRFLEIQKEFGSFDRYVWSFVGGRPVINRWKTLKQVPATTRESESDIIRNYLNSPVIVHSLSTLCPLFVHSLSTLPPLILRRTLHDGPRNLSN